MPLGFNLKFANQPTFFQNQRSLRQPALHSIYNKIKKYRDLKESDLYDSETRQGCGHHMHRSTRAMPSEKKETKFSLLITHDHYSPTSWYKLSAESELQH